MDRVRRSIAIVALLAAAACASVARESSADPQPISGAVDLGTEWIDITPPVPLRSTASIHHVALRMPEATWRGADWDPHDAERRTLTFADGRRGKIEAYLLDDTGQRYDLHVEAKGDGFELARTLPPRSLAGPPNTMPDFPKDRTYVKLRIRSEVPIHCERIEWTGYDPQ